MTDLELALSIACVALTYYAGLTGLIIGNRAGWRRGYQVGFKDGDACAKMAYDSDSDEDSDDSLPSWQDEEDDDEEV